MCIRDRLDGEVRGLPYAQLIVLKLHATIGFDDESGDECLIIIGKMAITVQRGISIKYTVNHMGCLEFHKVIATC